MFCQPPALHAGGVTSEITRKIELKGRTRGSASPSRTQAARCCSVAALVMTQSSGIRPQNAIAADFVRAPTALRRIVGRARIIGIADELGISRPTVRRCLDRYPAASNRPGRATRHANPRRRAPADRQSSLRKLPAHAGDELADVFMARQKKPPRSRLASHQSCRVRWRNLTRPRMGEFAVAAGETWIRFFLIDSEPV